MTSHPVRLYDGRILENIDDQALGTLFQEFAAERWPLEFGVVRPRLFTWEIACKGPPEPFVLQLPNALDEAGRGGRKRRDLPARNAENQRYFKERALGRYVVEPIELLTLGGDVHASLLPGLDGYRPLGFGRGAIQIELVEGAASWKVALGARATAEVLAELCAALAYLYEPELNGGTAVTDLVLNDGDFVVRRAPDGTFELKLRTIRRRESPITPSLLLLYLVQLMAYEDWWVDDGVVGLPTLLSNPSVAFTGLVRGLRRRAQDLGHSEDAAEREALRWIHEFGRSQEGHAYREFAERFVAGRLPLTFGEDLREHWWRLTSLQQRQSTLELQGRGDPSSKHAVSARAIRSFIDRLSRSVGHVCRDAPDAIRVNDLTYEELVSLLAEAHVSEGALPDVVSTFFARWPFRRLDSLIAQVPALRGLRRLKGRLRFGQVVSSSEPLTLESLERPKEEGVSRPLANHELFSARFLARALEAPAVATFQTFEAYMDSALHDPEFGYYGHGVEIGKAGHFDTHPEELTPHYGRWVARWALELWREMLAQGELAESDVFSLVEFGAGNGRLARDILDAVDQLAQSRDSAERSLWQSFALRLEYRVYELSASLREKQRALLGDRAIIAEGDARSPAAALQRDFPKGVRGLIVTNEVPDAFGVHKLALTAAGDAFAALVVPRVEERCRRALDRALSERIAEVDQRIRHDFALPERADEYTLDTATYLELMRGLSRLPASERSELLSALWFEEAYVPARAVPALAQHLRDNARDYALALAAEDSGVVLYINVHASRFITELARSLAAGAIATIDYGDTTSGLVQGARRGDFPFRVYGAWEEYVPRPNDPYAAPGTQDLTADVNFTELARAGQAAGLEVLHFGPERDVAGGELPSVLRSLDQPPFARFVGNPVFKCLVLGTRPSRLFEDPRLSPLPLYAREQDLPKTRRHLVAQAQLALENSSKS